MLILALKNIEFSEQNNLQYISMRDFEIRILLSLISMHMEQISRQNKPAPGHLERVCECHVPTFLEKKLVKKMAKGYFKNFLLFSSFSNVTLHPHKFIIGKRRYFSKISIHSTTHRQTKKTLAKTRFTFIRSLFKVIHTIFFNYIQ